MLRLTARAFASARRFIQENARGLDRALFEYDFATGSSPAVLAELAEYQNEDGGFGNWLESDFALAASSPMATSVAFEYLQAVNAPGDLGMVKLGIDYFLRTFNPEKQRWYAVPSEVNDAPHAPWWHYHEAEGGCLIDRSLGNPSAEIVGYLNRYRELVPPEFLKQLTDSFIGHLHALPDDADSMHEILSYLKMAENLRPEVQDGCREKLRRLVRNVTELDTVKWKEYGASPLFFVRSKDSPLVDLFPQALEANLDYLIHTQEEDGSWKPNWSWGQYKEAWQKASVRWSGHLTVRNLKVLSSFDRI